MSTSLSSPVCIFLRSSINYQNRSDLVPNDLEGVCLEIFHPNSKPFVIASIYRPPDCSSDFFTNFESMIKAIDNEDKELHILGDLNCNMLKHIPIRVAEHIVIRNHWKNI